MPDDAVATTASVASRDESSVRVLSIDRSRRHNSLTPELLADLRAAVAAARETDGLRALVLTTAGPSFSTGGDVREFAAREGQELRRYAGAIVGELNAAILDLLRVDVPVITAVQGPCTGGSLGLVLASDLTVAGPKAWFQPYYSRLGFSPDGGWTALLPQRVGRSRALAWQLTNERIDAPAALTAGLVTHLAPEPRTRALDLARVIASHAPGSLRRTAALLGGDLEQIAAALEAEREAFTAQILTPEAAAGMAAFLAGGSGAKGGGDESS